MSFDIDEEIAPLIRAMAAAGIETLQSCQDYDESGRVWLVLGSVDDLAEMLAAVGKPSENGGSIFQRLADHEVAAPYWPEDEPRRWRYALGPYPLGESWPLDWAFTVTLEFPRSDLATVTSRVEQYATLVEAAGLA